MTKTWMIFAGNSPAGPYAGPYSSLGKARVTLRWMRRHLFRDAVTRFHIRGGTEPNSDGNS